MKERVQLVLSFKKIVPDLISAYKFAFPWVLGFQVGELEELNE
jgi:hypothetical protein